MSTHDTPPPPTEQPDARRRFEMALMTVFGLASIVVLAVALGRYFSAPDAPF